MRKYYGHERALLFSSAFILAKKMIRYTHFTPFLHREPKYFQNYTACGVFAVLRTAPKSTAKPKKHLKYTPPRWVFKLHRACSTPRWPISITIYNSMTHIRYWRLYLYLYLVLLYLYVLLYLKNQSGTTRYKFVEHDIKFWSKIARFCARSNER